MKVYYVLSAHLDELEIYDGTETVITNYEFQDAFGLVPRTNYKQLEEDLNREKAAHVSALAEQERLHEKMRVLKSKLDELVSADHAYDKAVLAWDFVTDNDAEVVAAHDRRMNALCTSYL